ncbi:MAG: hypothetical protein JST67_10585 [Bacteroidetes bacterium]|nr:hypothetical protein [Bacteroidota bacterium]
MLRFFKINSYTAYLYLLLFAFFVGFVAVSFSFNASVFENSLLYPFFETVPNHFFVKIAGVLLLMLNVLFFDLLLTQQEVCDKNNHTAALLASVFWSYALLQNPLHPMLFAQLFFTAALWCFFSTYKKNAALALIFDGAFFLSLSALLYPPYFIFLALLAFCLLIFRIFSWREWLLSAIGVLLPFFIYASLLFLFNKNTLSVIKSVYTTFQYVSFSTLIIENPVGYSVLALFLFFTLLYWIMNPISNNVKTRKTLLIFMWLLLFSVFSWVFTENHSPFLAWLSVPALSVFIGMYVGNAKSRIFVELLLWLFIAAFVMNVLQQAKLI